jgi:4a-hydroxytetrahydrobiopterin dehydratase
MSEIIPNDEMEKWLRKSPEWELRPKSKSISRVFEFDEFMDAIDFVNSVAEIADESGHHPDIDIRFTNVRCSLITHDKNAVTKLDFEMASRIDTLVD